MFLKSTRKYCIIKVLPLSILLTLISIIAMFYGNDYFRIILPTLIIFIVIIIYKYYLLRSHEYTIDNERIKFKKGILSKETHYLELYRIIDLETKQSLLLQLISSMDLTLITSDRSHPRFVFYGIKNDDKFSEDLKVLIEEVRKTRVVEVD